MKLKEQTIEQIMEVEGHDASTLYEWWDIRHDGTKIAKIYEGFRDDVAQDCEGGCIVGVEYEDGQCYIVGCRKDSEVDDKEEMIQWIEWGL